MNTKDILLKAAESGGKFSTFLQPSGQCGGWVANWIRKCAVDKEAWDEAQFTETPYKLDAIDFYLHIETKVGEEKAADLMKVQRRAPEIRRDLKLAGGYDKLDGLISGTENGLKIIQKRGNKQDARMQMMMTKELEAYKELKGEVEKNGEPRVSGWMRNHVMKPQKSGVSPVTYIKSGADVRKGLIEDDGAGLEKLHETFKEGHLAYISLQSSKKGESANHAVGLHHLNGGWTAFFDPNIGEIDIPNGKFGKWVKFYWANSGYGYTRFGAKVFRRVGSSEAPS